MGCWISFEPMNLKNIEVRGEEEEQE